VINYLLIFVSAFTQNVCAFATNKQILERIAEFRDLLLIQEQLIYTSNVICHKIFIFSVQWWATEILEPCFPVLFWGCGNLTTEWSFATIYTYSFNSFSINHYSGWTTKGNNLQLEWWNGKKASEIGHLYHLLYSTHISNCQQSVSYYCKFRQRIKEIQTSPCNVYLLHYVLYSFFSCGSLIRFWVMASLYGASRSHSDTSHSVGLRWTSGRPLQRPILTTHNHHKTRTSMTPTGFEPKILTSERPQTQALDRAATRIDVLRV
jgi:hypothetical protein